MFRKGYSVCQFKAHCLEIKLNRIQVAGEVAITSAKLPGAVNDARHSAKIPLDSTISSRNAGSPVHVLDNCGIWLGNINVISGDSPPRTPGPRCTGFD